MKLVAIDVGGTHARFALAEIGADGAISVAEPVTLKTGDHPDIEHAWNEFERRCGCAIPRAAAIAIAGPVAGETVRMTNNSWVLHTGALDEQLGLDAVTVLNDFAAVTHAVARAPDDQFLHVAGPEGPLPDTGTISVIGPGTGLGVAHFHRFAGGYRVQATEGGHVGFAPADAVDDAVLARLRTRHGRVSTERVNSGPGIIDIHAVLAERAGQPPGELDDRTIWQRGLAGEDDLAAAAVDRFCMSLGSVAGDFALAHGAVGVALAGGLGYRLRDHLPQSGFAARFCAKGRHDRLMAALPVKLITHPQPGLFGAAAAFAMEHRA